MGEVLRLEKGNARPDVVCWKKGMDGIDMHFNQDCKIDLPLSYQYNKYEVTASRRELCLEQMLKTAGLDLHP